MRLKTFFIAVGVSTLAALAGLYYWQPHPTLVEEPSDYQAESFDSLRMLPSDYFANLNLPSPGIQKGRVTTRQDVSKAVVKLYNSNYSGFVPIGSSGFIIHPDGYVLTNAHVVASSPRKVIAQTVTGEKIAADFTLLGINDCADIALIKLQPAQPATFPWLEVASTAAPVSWASIYGFAGGKDLYATRGISVHLPNSDANTIKPLLRVNSMIGGGSSGGPILNPKLQVIGLNSQQVPKIFSNRSTNAGLSAEGIRQNIQDFQTRKFVQATGIGIGYSDLRFIDEGKAVADNVVSVVMPDSPAARKGIQPGQVVEAINGVNLPRVEVDPTDRKEERKAGQAILERKVRVCRSLRQTNPSDYRFKTR